MSMDFFDFLKLWRGYLKSLLICMAAACGLCVTYVLVVRPTHEAKTSLISVAAKNALGNGIAGKVIPQALTDIAGMGLDASQMSLLNILRSQTLREDVTKKLALYDVFFPGAWSPASEEERAIIVVRCADILKGAMKLDVNKEGLITIKIKMKQPAKLVANVANSFIDGLNQFIDASNMSENKKKIRFLERQIETIKDQVAELNISLLGFSPNSGTVEVDKEFLPIISEASRLARRLSLFQLESHILKNYFDLNSKLEEQLDAGLKQLRVDIKSIGKGNLSALPKRSNEMAILSLNTTPVMALEQVLLRQEQGRLLEILGLLRQQFELAKIEEAKEGNNFQVIDRATPYEIKVWPRPKLILAFVTLGVLFCHAGIVLALATAFRRKTSRERGTAR